MNRDKALGLYRLRIREILVPFRIYGQEPFVMEAENQIINQTNQLIKEIECLPTTTDSITSQQTKDGNTGESTGHPPSQLT